MRTTTIGFPRIGSKRQLKFSLESYWKSKQLLELARVQREVESESFSRQSGIDSIGCDATLYDQVLDTIQWLGLIPSRFREEKLSGLELYFAMARGATGASGKPCAALDMSKLYDTNYHFLVPEVERGFTLTPDFEPFLAKMKRAKEMGGKSAAAILIGPVTFISLAKIAPDVPRDEVLRSLLPIYGDMIRALAAIGITQVQMHEPALVTTAASTLRSDYEMAYSYIANLDLAVRTTLVSYYDDLEEEVCLWASQLPVDGLQLDFIGVPGAASSNRNLAHVIRHGFPSDKDLIAGVVDGRSVYADLGGSQARSILQALVSKGKVDPSRIIVSSSCSLQHLPFSLEAEEKIDPELRAKLAFAVEKVAEIKSAARGWSDSLPMTLVKPALESGSGKTLNTVDADSVREPFEIRRPKQMPFLPPFPTTTIGSFPQTKEIRSARALYRSGKITKEEYDVQMGAHIAYSVGVQEGLGIDVLVHGEAERTDMVEYFGEQLDGFHFTTNAWVQSYGSRCVKPPIIVGDVRFVRPMTVDTFRLAQSLTRKPMKGMLTGPVTILNWSFARKDVTRAMQCNQIAQAIRQEVAALEEAGAIVIQVDEPALREGLPLKKSLQHDYLDWAVKSFRAATYCRPETQMVTHFCYSEFSEPAIIQAIIDMDPDVVTIENSRSNGDDSLLRSLIEGGFRRDLGPGVYDVHSPLVPSVEFIKGQMRSLYHSGLLTSPQSMWVNPDCGLKTRGYPETLASLRNMVEAARELRVELFPSERDKVEIKESDHHSTPHRCC